MSDVKQTIQVTNAGLSPILSIAQGTGMVDFEFTISDFQIPAGSTAVAWNIQPTGNIVSQVCMLVGNVITVTPPAYYFLRGKNYMQIQVTGADSANLFTFLIEVWCSPNISAPVVSQNPDLISQLMAMIGNMQDLDTTAKNNLVAAINEIYARGVVDILDTEEEIEANTDAGKATGALVTKQLISELYQSTIATSEMTLINAIGYVCDNCILLDSSGRGTFLCTEGWYDYDVVKSSGDNCSGIINGHGRNNRETYSVFKETGADAVLKKLGNATFSMTWHHNAQANVVAGLYSSIDLPGNYDTLQVTPKTVSPSNTTIAFKVNGETKQTITSAGATIDLSQYNADIIKLEIYDPYNGRVQVIADITLS